MPGVTRQQVDKYRMARHIRGISLASAADRKILRRSKRRGLRIHNPICKNISINNQLQQQRPQHWQQQNLCSTRPLMLASEWPKLRVSSMRLAHAQSDAVVPRAPVDIAGVAFPAIWGKHNVQTTTALKTHKPNEQQEGTNTTPAASHPDAGRPPPTWRSHMPHHAVCARRA